ncbi:MAG: dTDP-glucose 4,6-dehydratase [Lacipirellulaceae bacterium]
MLKPSPQRRVVVTGGCGFIGSAVVRALLAGGGYEVLNYDALTYAGLPESVADVAAHPRYRFVQGDVCDVEGLSAAIEAFDADALLHLAAESHVDRSIAAPAEFVRTNVLGTATVVRAWLVRRDALAKCGDPRADTLRLVHVSTDEVYGSLAPGRAAREGDPYSPSSPYSASKGGADHMVQAYRTTYGQRSIVLHATNNYGPRQFPEKLLPLVTLRALSGEPLPIYGDGLQVREWLHVDDFCTALLAVLEQGVDGEAYHVGPGAGVTNLDLVRLTCDAVDQLRPNERPSFELVSHVEDRPGHDRRYALDCTKLRTELGWAPRVPLDEGVDATVRWYAENPAWVATALKRR